MSQSELYETLGVSPTATAEEIEKAYRKKAMALHPDRQKALGTNKDKEQLQKEFAAVQHAYDILSDPQKRQLYDAGQLDNNGHASWGNASSFDFEGAFGDFGDIFGEMFGGGWRSSRSSTRPQRGSDLRYSLTLTLEDIVFGTTTSIKITRLGRCTRCEGTGSRDKSKPSLCTTCRGKGQVYLQHGPFNIQQTCPDCHGQGKRVLSACPDCRGSGQAREVRTLAVKVPVGMSEGDQIRLAGEGEAGMQGGSPGDLYVQIHINPHPLFKRQEHDLYTEMPISYITAALGGEVEIPTLQGKVRLHIPPGTDNGKIFKLRGKGIPRMRGAAGDLFLTVVIEVPKYLTKEQTELLRSFELSLQENNAKYYPRIKKWVESIKKFFKGNTADPS